MIEPITGAIKAGTVSRNLCSGVTKTTRNNFNPNCLFTIQVLWGYGDD